MRRLLLVAVIHFVLTWVVRYIVIAAILANPDGWPGPAIYWAWFFPIQSTAWLWATGAPREDAGITLLLFALNSVCWASIMCAAWFCASRVIGVVRHRMGGPVEAGFAPAPGEPGGRPGRPLGPPADHPWRGRAVSRPNAPPRRGHSDRGRIADTPTGA